MSSHLFLSFQQSLSILLFIEASKTNQQRKSFKSSIMHFFNARFAFMALPLSIVTANERPPSSKECIAGPELLSSVPDKFQLVALTPDDKGKINYKASPRRFVTFGVDVYPPIPDPDFAIYYVVPQIDSGFDPLIFSLENNILTAEEEGPAWFLEDSLAYNFRLKTIVFDSKSSFEPALFTATEVSDSYGRNFLRLGGPAGELHSLFPLFLSLLSLNIR